MKELIKKIIGTDSEWESHIENIFVLFEKNLKEYHPKNILDVGSGDGQRTIRVAKYYNIETHNIFGVDYNDQCVTKAGQIPNMQKIDLETDILPHKADIFDLTICNQVLEHLINFTKVIDEITRVTRKGGYIIIGIPNLAHLINRSYLLLGLQPMCIHLTGPHVRGFTHNAFKKYLNTLDGLKLIDYTGALMYPLPLFISNFLAKYFIGLSGYTCYLLKKIK